MAAAETPAITPEDQALLERVADRVVALRLEVPAILTLETGKPLSLLAGQTMVFFEPLVATLLPHPDYRRFASLIERREVIERLIHLLESKADDAHAARRAAARAKRDAAKP